MRKALRPTVLPLALVLGLTLAACSSNGGSSGGGGSGGGGSSAPPATGGTTQTLTIQGFAFHPDTLTAPAGATVTIAVTNKDTTTHTFTLDDGSVSKEIPPGQTVDVTVTWPSSGTAGWHCAIHPSMTGTLKVG